MQIITDPEFTFDAQATERRLRYIQDAIACGLHSGIPPCCVRWYVTRWTWHFSETTARSSFVQRYRELMAARGAPFEFVPCPECLVRGRVERCRPCPDGSICREPADEASAQRR